MAGPVVQMPPAVSEMFDIIRDERGAVVALNMKQDWAGLLSTLAELSTAATRNGASSDRPTSDFVTRYVGMPYFDTSLGLPVFLKTATHHASTDVWVDAAGNPA